jgi:hypothetical protein
VLDHFGSRALWLGCFALCALSAILHLARREPPRAS